MRICELRQKEVINIRDGQRLGYIADIEFDMKNGCIYQLVIPGPCKFYGILGREIEYIVGWKCIHQIGEDVVLVDVNMEEITKKCSENEND